ncbi:MAG TPA: hypothetical protein VJA47_03945 [archaeon]|nr:hypothetical protein [archaeon]
MNFEIVATDYFVNQLKTLPEQTKKIIKSKIELVKFDPSRYKRIHSRHFSHVYRIRLNIENEESRLIYAVLGNKIVFVCILDRKNDYKDLEKYLEKIK